MDDPANPPPVARPGAVAGLSSADQSYVDQVRRATHRVGSPDLAPGDARGAIGAAAELVGFDVDAPIWSARPEGRLAKQAIKRAVRWYLRYLADQLTDFGQAVIKAADAVTGRVESLEEATRTTDMRLDALERRIAALAAPPLEPSATAGTSGALGGHLAEVAPPEVPVSGNPQG